MRLPVAFVAALSLTAVPVLAQPALAEVVTGPPGLHSVEPLVHHPTNMESNSGGQRIVPALPQASLVPSAPPLAFLRTAQRALESHRLGLAQSSLAHAETALLNRANETGFVRHPHSNRVIQNVNQALNALRNNNPRVAMRIVNHTIPMAQELEKAQYDQSRQASARSGSRYR